MTKSYRVLALATLAACATPPATQVDGPAVDWRTEWELTRGFRMEVDAGDFNFPTAIAFVARPGSRPEDPLYFVTELDGRVRVVANDRSVHLFAEGFSAFARPSGPPVNMGENGTAGICLDDRNGYVFVTFVYRDSLGVLRNDIVRFTAEPRRFSLQPRSRRLFTEIFAADASSDSHQIGSCQVDGGMLYVSVGDGQQPAVSQDRQTTLGKILRMDLDGRPVPSNPFFQSGVVSAANYVWALGFRNPFGLRLVRGRVFVTENGEGIDRFSEVEEGRNYLWDGHDWSIGINAAATFSPAVSPVQPDYLPSGSALFPAEYGDKFFVAFAGGTGERGLGLNGERSIAILDFDMSSGRMRQVPRQFVRFRGHGPGTIVALALGPDALYFAPFFPGANGRSPVYRVVHDPEKPHPFVIGDTDSPRGIIAEKGCPGCHRIEGRGGNAGPSLERATLGERLSARLNSPQYIDSLNAVDQMESEPFRSFAAARREIASASGSERVRVWLKYRLLEPRFDSPGARMPRLGLTEMQATALADYLLTAPTPQGRVERLRSALRHLPALRLMKFAVVFMLGLATAFALMGVRGFIRERRPDHQAASE